MSQTSHPIVEPSVEWPAIVGSARILRRMLICTVFSCCCGGLFTGLLVSPVTAAEPAPSVKDQPAAPGTETAASEPTFEYMLENRADPFTPFISAKAATAKVEKDEILDVNGPLTGMQRFEPGQLTLVAIMGVGNTRYAMVQDFTSKGYVIEEGTKIGRRGVVKTIGDNTVIVEETAVTRSGRKIISEVMMLLKKEGEQ